MRHIPLLAAAKALAALAIVEPRAQEFAARAPGLDWRW
jgi:hypothetical protein